jgi:hypothetical protein
LSRTTLALGPVLPGNILRINNQIIKYRAETDLHDLCSFCIRAGNITLRTKSRGGLMIEGITTALSRGVRIGAESWIEQIDVIGHECRWVEMHQNLHVPYIGG